MADLTIAEMCERAHETSKSKGWWEEDRNDAEMIALMHSELSEALEALRKPGPSEKLEGFSALEEELADVLIRIGDFCQARGVRLTAAVRAKDEYNRSRPHRHGGKKF